MEVPRLKEFKGGAFNCRIGKHHHDIEGLELATIEVGLNHEIVEIELWHHEGWWTDLRRKARRSAIEPNIHGEVQGTIAASTDHFGIIFVRGCQETRRVSTGPSNR